MNVCEYKFVCCFFYFLFDLSWQIRTELIWNKTIIKLIISRSGLPESTGNPRLSKTGPEAPVSSWSIVPAESPQPQEENKPAAQQRWEAGIKSRQQ